jgi:hypothetical protein
VPDLYLYQGEASPRDLRLRDPTTLAGVIISGIEAASDADDALSSAAALAIASALASSDAGDTVSSAAALALAAALANTDAGDTLSSATALALAAALARTDADDAQVSTTALAIAGLLTATDAADALAFTATLVTVTPILGTLSKTDTDTLVAQGKLLITGRLAAITESDDMAPSRDRQRAFSGEQQRSTPLRQTSRAARTWRSPIPTRRH